MDDILKTILNEAQTAAQNKEIPVGAVVVKNGIIIAKGRNTRQFKNNVLGHAEINAILNAEKKNKDWRLDDFELYVTLEPCALCQMVIKECRIKKVYYLISKTLLKSKDSGYIQISGYAQEKEDYQNLLQNFFKNLRQ